IQATAASKDNRFFGNVSLNDDYGMVVKARGDHPEEMPLDSLVRDLVVIGSDRAGFYSRAARNTTCDHCTLMPQAGPAFVADDNPRGGRGDARYSVEIKNSLSKPIGSSSHGVLIANQGDWRIDHVWASGNGTPFQPGSSDAHVTNSRAADPGLGSCRLWL